MMTSTEDRLMELLIEKGERALTDQESVELRSLLQQSEGWHVNDFDYAAAAAHVALDPPTEAMPEALKARIIGDAVHRATTMQTTGAAPSQRDLVTQSAGAAPAANDNKPQTGRILTWMGWATAVAAAVVAVVGWQDQLIAPPELAEMRSALVETDSSIMKVAWTKTEDPLGTKVTGDVVWSDERQEGYMRFAGLPKNNPTEAQYQLWVFDKEGDARYPIDGGVFDVNTDTGEVIVAIKTAIKVNKATLFAVTLEKPGGVVVSTRERLVTLAKPAA